MIIPVRCVTCGMPIGDKYDLFKFYQQKLIDDYCKERDIIPEKASADLHMDIDCIAIFEKLHIYQRCCRMHITTPIYFY